MRKVSEMMCVEWKRYLLFVGALLMAFAVGCGSSAPKLLDHEPTKEELKTALEEAFYDVFRNSNLREDTVARLAPPKTEWAIMGKQERERHMARFVMPVMLTLFQSFDRRSSSSDFDQEHWSQLTGSFGQRTSLADSFSCLTCHGERFPSGNITDFDFARPTHLYPLDPKNLPTEENPGRSSARMIRFMKYTVTPAMRVLLGRTDVNCFTCHQVKK